MWRSIGFEVADAKLRSFFRIITINLPVGGTDSMIETQAQEVLKRIPAEEGTCQAAAAKRTPLLQDLMDAARRAAASLVEDRSIGGWF